MQRIIGEYTGHEKGPLLICLAGIHGNEPAGVNALQLIFKMIEVEPITNPNFHYRGRIVGLRGNVKALKQERRFIKKDLNRQWTKARVEHVKKTSSYLLDAEDREMKEIIKIVDTEIEQYQPETVILLDLHTTTATGGIFTIPTNDPESLEIALELHAPVVKGMLDGISGTILHYFNNENFGTPITAVCFESGQHNEELSTNRAIAAIINCMRTIDAVLEQDVENRHDALLIEHSMRLPRLAKLVYCHRLNDGDGFTMLPDYKNFQMVHQGEVLAKDREGEIRAPYSGLILMPHYQKQGEDGFFIIKMVEGY